MDDKTEWGSKAAYLGAILLVGTLASAAAPAGSFVAAGIANWLGIAFHLLLFLVVAALPAPAFARAAGYGWLTVATMLHVAALNGADPDLIHPLRLGSHVIAALWVGPASWIASRSVYGLGNFASFLLAVYPALGPYLPEWTYYFSGPALVLWLAAVGLHLGRGATRESVEAEEAEESAA